MSRAALTALSLPFTHPCLGVSMESGKPEGLPLRPMMKSGRVVPNSCACLFDSRQLTSFVVSPML